MRLLIQAPDSTRQHASAVQHAGRHRVTIDWNSLTPLSALLGGLTIGLASALYILGNGRVAGIAGIVASPLRAIIVGKSLAP